MSNNKKKRQETLATSIASTKPTSLRDNFSNHDLFWIMIGIILLIVLGYAVIHFDIVSIEAFTAGMSKYNVTNVAAVANAQ